MDSCIIYRKEVVSARKKNTKIVKNVWSGTDENLDTLFKRDAFFS